MAEGQKLSELGDLLRGVVAKGEVNGHGVYVSGISEHLKGITDQDQRRKEALSLYVASQHTPELNTQMREEAAAAFRELQPEVQKKLEDDYIAKGYKSLNKKSLEEAGKELTFDERKALGEQAIADLVLRPIAEYVEGPAGAKALFQDLDEPERLDDIQKGKIRDRRAKFYSELVGDVDQYGNARGEKYMQLLDRVMTSKDLQHDLNNEEGELYKALSAVMTNRSEAGKELLHLNRNMQDLYQEPGTVSEVGVPHFNTLMKGVGHDVALSSRSVTNLAELKQQVGVYHRAGSHGIREGVDAGAQRNPPYEPIDKPA